MRKVLLAATAIGALASFQSSARADLLDPLHGECNVGCPENTSNSATPITQGQTELNFGFGVSPPGTSGSLELVFLIPNIPADAGFTALPTITGDLLASPAVHVSGLFQGGGSFTLENFLGITASPSNPLSAFVTPDDGLPGLGTFTSAMGYNVFTIQVGSFNSLCNCNTPADQFAMQGLLPIGTDIVGYLTEADGTVIGTAPSGQLEVAPLAAPVPGPIVGAGFPGLIAGCLSLLGLNRLRRKRNDITA